MRRLGVRCASSAVLASEFAKRRPRRTAPTVLARAINSSNQGVGREQTLKPALAMIVVGLTPRHLGVHTPRLAKLAREGAMLPLKTITPALTCSVQASFMTGLPPREHGIVGNGWLFRDQMEVMLWRQSNRLVGGEKVWEAGKKRDAAFTCANMFWWYNMASSHRCRRDAAADLQGGRTQTARLLHGAGHVAPSADRASGSIPVVSVLGAGNDDRIEQMGCRRDQDRHGRERSDADARLPSAPGL